MISNVKIEGTGAAAPQAAGCGCGCGHSDIPRMEARELPKQIRHGAIIGALMSLPTGGQMDLVAPHAPHPLLRQIEEMAPGAFEVETIDDDPQAYIVRFTRN